MSGPFKMNGMTFREGQTPIKSLSDVGKRIAANVKKKVSDVVTHVKNIPKNIKSNVENIVLGPEEGEESEVSSGSVATVAPPDIDTNVNVKGTIVKPDDKLIDVTKIVPTTPTASPVTKKSPARRYKKKGSTMGSYKSMKKIKK